MGQEIQASTAKCQMMESKVSFFQNAHNDQKQQIQSLNDKISLMQKENQLLKGSNDDYKQENESLNYKVSSLEDERKKFEMTIDDLKNENKELQLKLENLNFDNYEEWTADEIVQWILSLNPEIYGEYEQILRKSLIEENVNGTDLDNVDSADIKRWGIKKFKHIKQLLKVIKSLTQDQNKQTFTEGANTPIDFIG